MATRETWARVSDAGSGGGIMLCCRSLVASHESTIRPPSCIPQPQDLMGKAEDARGAALLAVQQMRNIM